MLRKIKIAVIESSDFQFLHNQFELGLPQDYVGRWTSELAAWEDDHRLPNPFVKRFKSMFSMR